MRSQFLEIRDKIVPLQVKVFFLITLFSILFIFSTDKNVIGPILDEIHNLNSDNPFAQLIDYPEQISKIHLDDEMLQIKKYRESRGDNFDSWFGEDNKIITNADNNGTIFDFSIVGMSSLHKLLYVMKQYSPLIYNLNRLLLHSFFVLFPFFLQGFAKCGTTSMEANLGSIAPMPISDVCTPLAQSVYYAYKNWPNEYNANNAYLNQTKILRGTKCPKHIGYLDEYSRSLPKTLLIVGIRHPILFYQSFWNMQADNRFRPIRDKSPYDFMEHCAERGRNCINECPRPNILCLHRTRFHLHLARIGKTQLNNTERELLAPDDKDGGFKLTNFHIKNPIFLYEMSQLNEDETWAKLAKELKVPYIPHDIHKGHHSRRFKSDERIDICDAKFDDFRSKIMPHAYNMSKWLCDYLVPVAMNETRNDVIIPDPENFCKNVKSYEDDPCNRLVRADDGRYILGKIASNSSLEL